MTQEYFTRLRREREQRGWSRSYVAERVGVDVATVGRWERGERLPHPHYRQKLCALFEMNAQDLGLFSELPENLDDVTDHCIPVPPVYEKSRHVPSQLLRDRRGLLAGLGGFGIAAFLAGSAWIFSSHTSSLPAIARKPLLQLLSPNPSNWVNNLAWSPDGSMLAAANDIPLVTTWNVKKDALLYSYPTLSQWVNDVTWSNANRIAAATADGLHLTGAVQIWTFPRTSLSCLTLPRAYPLRTVSWSPDGEYLAFAGHNTMVEIWGPISGSPTSRYLEASQSAIAMSQVEWSSDAAYIAAAADDGAVYVWELATGELKGTYQGHAKRVVSIAWSPRGYLIASASVDKTAQVWDMLARQNIVTYRGHTGEVHGIDWSPDGQFIVSAGYDASAQVWEALTGKPVARCDGLDSGLLCARWSGDGHTIALGSKQEGVSLWQAPFS